MNRIANYIKGYTGINPFRDNQSRNYSDSKLLDEFCPTTSFWSLFNDQHEIIIGARGSGKTFLLKMMRFSMLRRINDPKAKDLVEKKAYFSLYIPLHLEFVASLRKKPDEIERIQLFQFAFNCLLAESLISEIKAFIKDTSEIIEYAKKNYEITQYLHKTWFNTTDEAIIELDDLCGKIKQSYSEKLFSENYLDPNLYVFFQTIGSPLLNTKTMLAKILGFYEEPTWILCVDEAEFLDECFQKCINTVFRSDSDRIAYKVATLPFYHKTLETLQENTYIVPNNDFSYRVVDMPCDSVDFKNFTNQLCINRVSKRLEHDIPETTKINTLEDFVGTIGKDDQIDYYRCEVGNDYAERSYIESQIISQFSERRRDSSKSYTNKRKTIYDKFAPIFFVREMYKLSKQGNRKPGWYAGSEMIRRISQGNPRLFIQIMNEMFSTAQETELTPKKQHEILYEFVSGFCKATQAIEIYGPLASDMLNIIAENIHEKVHNSYLKSTGSNFSIKYLNNDEFERHKNWIQLAIAYSRIQVSVEKIVTGIDRDTEFILSNAYSAFFWIPMRADGKPKVFTSSDLFAYEQNAKKCNVKRTAQKVKNLFPSQQLTLFNLEDEDEDEDNK